MDTDSVTYTFREDVSVITLNKPEALNALDQVRAHKGQPDTQQISGKAYRRSCRSARPNSMVPKLKSVAEI